MDNYIPYEESNATPYDPKLAASLALGVGGAGLTGMVMANALKGEVRNQVAPIRNFIDLIKTKTPKHLPLAAGLTALLGGGYLLKKKLSE